MIGVLLLLLSLLQNTARVEASKNAYAPVKPTISVSLGRQSVQENDSVQVEIWIANESEYELSNVDLIIVGPDFLRWHDGSCENPALQRRVSLGAIQPRSITTRQLCFKTNPLIKVGEFNILFTIEYQWNSGTGPAKSFVSQEKVVKVNILGSDNVAGVPLALAGFVVPGLFFWFVVRLFGAPWNVGVALGDKLIYSMLISVTIVAASSWTNYVSISGGISINILIRLALIGIVFGAIIGGADYFLRRAQHRKAAEKEIKLGEDEKTLLRKLLKINSKLKPSTATVRLRNNEEYVGSLLSRSADTITLIGWFRINLEGLSDNICREMKTLEKRGKLTAILDLAKKNNIEIVLVDAIKQKQGDKDISTGDGSRQWNNSEVLEATVEERDDSILPLSLVE